MSLTRASYLLKDALQRAKQHVRGLNRKRLYKRKLKRGHDYEAWLASHETREAPAIQTWRNWFQTEPNPPSFTILPTPGRPLGETISSKLNAQHYPHWASEPSSLASDSEWLLFLAPEDQLRPDALLAFAYAARLNPQAGLIYCDHDHLDPHQQRTSPYFKPRWNHQLQQSTGYVGHSFVIKRDLFEQTKTLGPWTSEAFHFDLVLRCAELIQAKQIVHIPNVLWHNSVDMLKARLGDAHVLALQSHLDRTAPGSQVQRAPHHTFRVQHPLPSPHPLVSILICTRNQYQLLKTCIDSITHKTTYQPYEIIIVDNGSDEPRTLEYLQVLQHGPHRIQVIRDDSPFNYSALNNLAARHAKGSVYALLNNDIEVIEPQWLDEMVAHALQPDTGCVGAKLLYPNETIQHAGILLGGGDKVNGQAIATHYFRGLPKEHAGYLKRAVATSHVSAVTGACLVIKKETFDRVNGLNEKDLAVAYNDVDFCLRVAQLGLQHVYTPFATLYHHESISRGRDKSAEKQNRFAKELTHMRDHWSEHLKDDPFYSPNLNSSTGDFLL